MNLKGIVITDQPAQIELSRHIAKLIARDKPQTLVLISRGGDIFNDGISLNYGIKTVGETLESDGRKTFSAPTDLELLEHLRDHLTEDNRNFIAVNDRIVAEYGINRRLDPLYASLMTTVQNYYPNFKMVEIKISGENPLTHYAIGTSLRKAIESSNRSLWILAEGYTDRPYPQLKKLLEVNHTEALLRYIIKEKDPDLNFTAKGILMALGVTDGLRMHTNSSLPFKDNEAYCMTYRYAVDEEPLTISSVLEIFNKNKPLNRDTKKNIYLELAWKTLEHIITARRRVLLKNFLKDKSKEERKSLTDCQKGVFITLYEYGELRGCMGTLYPVTDNLGEEIIRNTIESAINDNRFAPMEAKDLPNIEIVMDIIEEVVPLQDFNGLDPKQFGLIAEQGLSKGILLPDLGGIDTAQEQIDNVCRVGGIIKENKDIEPIYYSLLKTTKIK